jgi:hypothetical protein
VTAAVGKTIEQALAKTGVQLIEMKCICKGGADE